jgi:hypothetical protein
MRQKQTSAKAGEMIGWAMRMVTKVDSTSVILRNYGTPRYN